jgi:hypothetical protein
LFSAGVPNEMHLPPFFIKNGLISLLAVSPFS